MKLYSGWILSALCLVISYGPFLLVEKEKIKRGTNYSFCSYGKVFLVALWIFFFFPIVYAVFLDIHFGSVFFYTGAVIFTVGALSYLISFINYCTTPLDQPIKKGLYQISRNPMYVSGTLILIAMALMLHSWIIGIMTIVGAILQHFMILDEERFCEIRHGDSYLNFKKSVPRYLFF